MSLGREKGLALVGMSPFSYFFATVSVYNKNRECKTDFYIESSVRLK